MSTMFKQSSGYTGSVKPKFKKKHFFLAIILFYFNKFIDFAYRPLSLFFLALLPFMLPPYLCSPAFSHLGHCATAHASLQVYTIMAPHSQCQPGNTALYACSIYTMIGEVYAGNSQYHDHLTPYSGTSHWSWQSLIWFRDF